MRDYLATQRSYKKTDALQELPKVHANLVSAATGVQQMQSQVGKGIRILMTYPHLYCSSQLHRDVGTTLTENDVSIQAARTGVQASQEFRLLLSHVEINPQCVRAGPIRVS